MIDVLHHFTFTHAMPNVSIDFRLFGIVLLGNMFVFLGFTKANDLTIFSLVEVLWCIVSQDLHTFVWAIRNIHVV